jgi:hypothetical protein
MYIDIESIILFFDQSIILYTNIICGSGHAFMPIIFICITIIISELYNSHNSNNIIIGLFNSFYYYNYN